MYSASCKFVIYTCVRVTRIDDSRMSNKRIVLLDALRFGRKTIVNSRRLYEKKRNGRN